MNSTRGAGEEPPDADAFVGREWVLRAIDGWLSEPEPPVFLLTGAPGTGKSAIAARLTAISDGTVQSDEHPHLGPGTLTYAHCCQAQDDATLHPLRFIEGLAQRLAASYEPYRQAVAAVPHSGLEIVVEQHFGVIEGGQVTGVNIENFELHVHALAARDVYDRVIARPLETLGAAGVHEQIVVLIDGIDEALTFHAEDHLVDLLTHVAFRATAGPRMRFLLTCRSGEVRVLDRIEAQRPNPRTLDLRADAPAGHGDIYQYGLRQLGNLPEPRRRALAEQVASVADGVFLSARYMLEDLAADPERTDETAILTLPNDLSDHYRRFMRRELAPDRSHEPWQIYHRVLGLLAVARSHGLTHEQIAGASQLPAADTRKALAACAQFIENRPGGAHRIFHQSFRDFLLRDATFRVSPIEAHQALSRYFLDVHAADWSGCNDDYAVRYAPLHLHEAGLIEELGGVLSDFGWLQGKLTVADISAVLDDYDLLPEDHAAQVVRDALRLSMHVLASDKGQLPSQVVGRLGGHPDPRMQRLVEQAKQSYKAPWLCPGRPNLSPPGGPLVFTLGGHTEHVSAVAVTPDGRHAISGSHDHTLRIWDLNRGVGIGTLRGHTGRIIAVAVTADGRQIVSAGQDGTIRIWDLTSQTQMAQTLHHELFETPEVRIRRSDGVVLSDKNVMVAERVTAIAVLSGGLIVSTSQEGTIQVWDPVEGTKVVSQLEPESSTGNRYLGLSGHDPIKAMVVLPDAQRVILGLSGSTQPLRIWDLVERREVKRLGKTFVDILAITPDGRHLLAGWADDIELWDLKERREPRRLQGHTDMLTSIVVSPDGRVAASCAGDHTIRLWEIPTGTQLGVLLAHEHLYPHLGVGAAAFTPTGDRLVSGGYDGTVKVWNLQHRAKLGFVPQTGVSGRPVHDHGVRSVAVTPDGHTAVSGSRDSALAVWDLHSGSARRLTGHEGAVNAVAVSSNGQRLLSGSSDRTVMVWDRVSGTPLLSLAGHKGAVNAVAATPDGRRVVSGSTDRTLRLWNLDSGALERELSGHLGPVNTVAVTPNGRLAVSGSDDRTARVWDLKTGRQVHVVGCGGEWVNAVAITGSGRRAVLGCSGGTIHLLDLERGVTVGVFRLHHAAVNAVAVTPDGRRAISGSWDGSLKVWDLRRDLELGILHGHEQAVSSIAVTPDGRRAISGSWDRSLKLWDLDSLAEIEIDAGQAERASIFTVAATADGRLGITGGAHGVVRIWDLPNRQPLHKLVGHGSAVDEVTVTADGRLAASVDRQWTIRVWNPRSGEEVASLQAGSLGRGYCAGIRFSSDGRQVIVGQADGTFQAWDFETDDLRTISRVEDGNGDLRMSALAITPDAQLAVTGSVDGAVRVWDLQRGTRLHTFTDHSVMIWSVAVTADGRWALSGSADGSCRLWDPVAGTAVGMLGGQGHGVQAVAITPDGTWACVARTDNTLSLWQLAESRPVARFTTDNPIHYATCAVVAAETVLILAGETSGRMHILELKA